MKIGIDLDGVVIDSETTFRTYEEIFDIDILKGNNLINKKEPKFQARYNWTNEQEKEFIEKYFMTVSKESNLMSGFVGIYNLLKEQGHQFVVITARGGFIKEMKYDAIRLSVRFPSHPTIKESVGQFGCSSWKLSGGGTYCERPSLYGRRLDKE